MLLVHDDEVSIFRISSGFGQKLILLHDIMSEHSISQLVENFTRITRNSSAKIDLILTNDKQPKHEVYLAGEQKDKKL